MHDTIGQSSYGDAEHALLKTREQDPIQAEELSPSWDNSKSELCLFLKVLTVGGSSVAEGSDKPEDGSCDQRKAAELQTTLAANSTEQYTDTANPKNIQTWEPV